MSDDVTMHPDGSVTIDINLDRHPHLSVLLLARAEIETLGRQWHAVRKLWGDGDLSREQLDLC
jgi:hypothetical protein